MLVYPPQSRKMLFCTFGLHMFVVWVGIQVILIGAMTLGSARLSFFTELPTKIMAWVRNMKLNGTKVEQKTQQWWSTMGPANSKINAVFLYFFRGGGAFGDTKTH